MFLKVFGWIAVKDKKTSIKKRERGKKTFLAPDDGLSPEWSL